MVLYTGGAIHGLKKCETTGVGGDLPSFLADGGCPRALDGSVGWQLVAEDVEYELAVAEAHFKDMDETGTAEHDGEGRDQDEQAEEDDHQIRSSAVITFQRWDVQRWQY